jgi:hypothetical protein
VDIGLSTKVFDPLASPVAFNAILIQASSAENFNLDSVEIVDAQGAVVEHASGITYSNLVTSPNEILGPPDGVRRSRARTAIISPSSSRFTPCPSTCSDQRQGCRCPRGPGDVETLGSYTSLVNERPGGLAIDENGVIYLTLTVDKSVKLARYSLDGAFQDDIGAGFGSHGDGRSPAPVALGKNGAIYTAATVSNGAVAVRKHQATLADEWIVGFSSGLGGDRVESNGLAVEANGDVFVAGGMNSVAGGLNHWMAKLSNAGIVGFDKRPLLDSSATTCWRAVTTKGGNHVYATGDQASETLNLLQVQTVRFGGTGVAQWDDQFGGEDGLPDAGNAIAPDEEENIFVGGVTGTPAHGRDAVLIKYGDSGVPLLLVTHNGVANGDDEILDFALDPDGSIYAVGYETVAGQGENMWIRKYDANLAPIWTRTHHGGFGNDRAISVAIYGDQVVVAGFETVSSGKTKLALRVYAR